MNNPYLDFIQHNHMEQALLVAASTPEDKLSALAARLTDEQVTRFESLTLSKLNNLHVKSMVWAGGMLYLHRCLAERKDRTKSFQEQYAELGYSETKAYAAMAVYRCFGQLLLSEPELISRFPLESLKMLSASGAAQRAQEAAIALAKQGTRVTMKLAEELLYKHAETYEHGAEAQHAPKLHAAKTRNRISGKRAKPRGKKVWSYKGEVVNLVVESPTSMVNSDPQSVIRDLEAALDSYRRDFVLNGSAEPDNESDDHQEDPEQSDAEE